MVSEYPQAVVAALETAEAFVTAFSARDYETLAATLNYPHVRLAEGRFATIDSPEAFVERCKKVDNRHALDRDEPRRELGYPVPVQLSGERLNDEPRPVQLTNLRLPFVPSGPSSFA